MKIPHNKITLISHCYQIFPYQLHLHDHIHLSEGSTASNKNLHGLDSHFMVIIRLPQVELAHGSAPVIVQRIMETKWKKGSWHVSLVVAVFDNITLVVVI